MLAERLYACLGINRLNPFREYVKTDGYIAQTWFVGLLAGVAAALCFWAALQSIRGGG
jgi:hypothetical protein